MDRSTLKGVLARWLVAATFVAACSSCAMVAERPFMMGDAGGTCTEGARADPDRGTPLRADGYTLHFVEFDDQGWVYPNAGEGTPARQIDCAVEDLSNKLKAKDSKVLTFVYVHGWKHSAANDDDNLKRFRDLLASRVPLFPDRHVVGIYVGWQGRTIDLPLVENASFWGRKNAAGRVADGRVRELFSRIRGLRAYWNGPQVNGDEACDTHPTAVDRCRLRTIMIGHSFGGLILFNSAEPYLLEVLSIDRDLPPNARQRVTRARGIADLIVLLNPAFEGSRFEPLFEASLHYSPSPDEPPLLVMVTSTADRATKNAFPVARWVNSIFQYPATSEEESIAMKRTLGHIDRYLTHELCHGPTCGDDQTWDSAAGRELGMPEQLGDALVLRPYTVGKTVSPPIVWNVRTNATVIQGHNDIDGEKVVSFVAQVYGRVINAGAATNADRTTTANSH